VKALSAWQISGCFRKLLTGIVDRMRIRARTGIAARASDGVKLHVEEHGNGPVTLVLLHGWTLDRRLWRRQVTSLTRRMPDQIRVLAVDLRGHGQSGTCDRRDTTLARLADDIWTVLRAFAADGPVVLAGHSLGGMAIIEFAHRYPEEIGRRVAGVALISTSAEGHAHTSYGLAPWLGRVVRHLEVGGAALLARSGPWRVHGRVMPALGPAVRWLVFGEGVEQQAIGLTLAMVSTASLNAIGGFRPSISRMNRVAALRALAEIPVAVLVGAKDRLTPPKCTEAIVEALPEADLRVFEGCGHMLPLECPDAVTEVLADVCRAALKRPR
jgi:pimeloyl-ACP methyl ester carboxylesterase